MASTDSGEPGSASDVLRPLPRAIDGQVALAVGRARMMRPGRTAAGTVQRAQLVGRARSVRLGADDGRSPWLARPRWVDVEATAERATFEPPITGDARYDALIRSVRARYAAKKRKTPKEPGPGPGIPRASARRGTMAGGGTGPGEGGTRLDPRPVKPKPSPALKGIVASAAPTPPRHGQQRRHGVRAAGCPELVVATVPSAEDVAPSPSSVATLVAPPPPRCPHDRGAGATVFAEPHQPARGARRARCAPGVMAGPRRRPGTRAPVTGRW